MPQRTAVLLVNLGTPRSPKLWDVLRYLNEFLTDPRVIDLPWLKRQLLVRGVIVPARVRQSAQSYQRIWTKEGSPLMVYGCRVKEALQIALGESFHVELAMRYQQPTLKMGLDKLMRERPDRLIVLPLFPQYASATTGSVHQKVMELLRTYTTLPSLTFISHFATHPAFHEALSKVAEVYPIEKYDHVLFSYHGLPQRQLKKADPNCLPNCPQTSCCTSQRFCYKAHCLATTKGVVERLHISPHKYSNCFQSRLGKEPWLEPYTSDRIVDLAKQGQRRVLVFCPSFVCDCLETLFEIGEEYGHLFKKAGGETLDLVPGLNDHPVWISALKKILIESPSSAII